MKQSPPEVDLLPPGATTSTRNDSSESQGIVTITTTTILLPPPPTEEKEEATNQESKEHEHEHDTKHNEPFLNGSTKAYSTYEDIQTIIGQSGAWQLRVFLLASFSGLCTSLHNFIYGFIGVVPEHWCELPDVPVNLSRHELRKQLTSKISDKYNSCMQHSWIWDSDRNLLQVNESEIITCKTYEFDHSEFQSTVPTEWQLVCEDATWAPSIQATYMVGLLIGAPVFGAISDRMGRKHAILIATLIFTITGPLIAFSPSFAVLLALRFILALALPGVYACSYVLAIEVISERWRSFAGNYFNLPFALGYTILPIIAYFVRSWKDLQILCSLPSLVLLITWWCLPESPRWLIRKGRLDEAERILRRAAVVNKREASIPEDFRKLIKTIYDQERDLEVKRTFWDGVVQALNEYFSIVKSPRMRTLFLTLLLCWFTIGMAYYGLGLNSSNLSTDRYVYTLITGLLEFPGYLMVAPLINRLGRKRVFIGFMWTCGMSLIISLFLPKGSMGIILLSYLGKLVIGANFSLVYLYSSEMLPTLVRNCALGVCSMMGRLGSTFAPLINDIVGRYHPMYPLLIFGCMAMFAGCLSLILPETQNRRLPETIEEVESGSGKKIDEQSGQAREHLGTAKKKSIINPERER